MANSEGASSRSSLPGVRRLSSGTIAAVVLAAVVVTCIGAVILTAALRGGRAYQTAGSATDEESMVMRAGMPEPAYDEAMGEAEQQKALGMAPMEAAGASHLALQALGDSSQPDQERLIVRSGNITLRVGDTLAAQEAVEALVARWAGEGAYVVSSEQRGGDDGADPYISMAIRVPAAHFGEAMDGVADLAVDVPVRSEVSQDVTEEYVDLAGRLEALETARDRLLEIMSAASRTEDVLQAEEQLTRREEEIEATQGRMQYLAQSAALARIWIELQPYVLSQPVGQRWRPAETVREALEALLDSAQGIVDLALFVGIAVLPWLLALGLALFLVYRFVRWAVRRRQAPRPHEEAEPGA